MPCRVRTTRWPACERRSTARSTPTSSSVPRVRASGPHCEPSPASGCGHGRRRRRVRRPASPTRRRRAPPGPDRRRAGRFGVPWGQGHGRWRHRGGGRHPRGASLAGRVVDQDRGGRGVPHREPDRGGVLLKTIEEPPVRTTIVLLAESVPPAQSAIASSLRAHRLPRRRCRGAAGAARLRRGRGSAAPSWPSPRPAATSTAPGCSPPTNASGCGSRPGRPYRLGWTAAARRPRPPWQSCGRCSTTCGHRWSPDTSSTSRPSMSRWRSTDRPRPRVGATRSRPGEADRRQSRLSELRLG